MTDMSLAASTVGWSTPTPSATMDSAGAYWAGRSITGVRSIWSLTDPDIAGMANSVAARLISSAETFGLVTVMTASTNCCPGHRDAISSVVPRTFTASPTTESTIVALPPEKVIEPSTTGESKEWAASATAVVSLARSTWTFRGWSSPPVRRAHICTGFSVNPVSSESVASTSTWSPAAPGSMSTVREGALRCIGREAGEARTRLRVTAASSRDIPPIAIRSTAVLDGTWRLRKAANPK